MSKLNFRQSKTPQNGNLIIQAQSAGFNGGNHGIIKLNNKIVKMDKNENGNYRGLHIVIVSKLNGKVEFKKVFDTYESS